MIKPSAPGDGTWGRSQLRSVAAINGSYFDLGTGEPNSGIVLGGWYTKMFSDLGGWSGFAWKEDRSAFVGACVDHPAGGQIITNLISGDQLMIDGINSKVKDNQLVVFTPQFDTFSPGQKNGAEVLVGLYQPLGLRSPDDPALGTVISIHPGKIVSRFLLIRLCFLRVELHRKICCARYAKVMCSLSRYSSVTSKPIVAHDPHTVGRGPTPASVAHWRFLKTVRSSRSRTRAHLNGTRAPPFVSTMTGFISSSSMAATIVTVLG